jgi:hypothetical protein
MPFKRRNWASTEANGLFDVVKTPVSMLIGLATRPRVLGVGLPRDKASPYFNAVLDDPGAFWEILIFLN